jgi:LmbE family N-acetylglucosaminyl deacetylase
MTGCRYQLPGWRSVLAVVAHPDDESFGLGAILAAFAARGAAVSVLCFTRGEASTLSGVPGDLAAVRAAELAAAARALGIGEVTLLGYPDGRLDQVPVGELVGHVVAAADQARAVGLMVFDPSGVTGHRDHRQATAAALAAAAGLGLPVLGWTLPADVAAALNAEYDTAFGGNPASGVDLTVTVDRTRQRAAVRCHPSQAVPGSVLWRRLDLLGDTEHLRWLHGQTTHRGGHAHTPRDAAHAAGPGRHETLGPGRPPAARATVDEADVLP